MQAALQSFARIVDGIDYAERVLVNSPELDVVFFDTSCGPFGYVRRGTHRAYVWAAASQVIPARYVAPGVPELMKPPGAAL